MKKISLLLLVLFYGCDLPIADEYQHGPIEVYVDNSKLKEFDIQMVYGGYIDTIGYSNKEVIKFDTLFFSVKESGVDKHIVNGKKDNFFISVYSQKNVEIILKKDGEIIEKYTVDIEPYKWIKDIDNGYKVYGFYYRDDYDKTNYQYILNPLSLSKYKIDTVTYGGFGFLTSKSKFLTGSFNNVNLIDWWFESPPDTLKYLIEKSKDSRMNRIRQSKFISENTFSIERVE